jgi:hypothetical protein
MAVTEKRTGAEWVASFILFGIVGGVLAAVAWFTGFPWGWF